MTIDILSQRGDYKAQLVKENLFYQRYYSEESQTNADWETLSLFLFYGFGEHLERYSPLISLMISHFASKEINLDVIIIDYPGHGKSSGARGHLANFNDLTVDLSYFVNEKARHRYLLMGKGLGALCILQMIHDHHSLLSLGPLGAVLINPALKVKWRLPKFLEEMNIERIGTLGKIRMPFRVDEARVVDISQGQSLFDEDPLVSHHPTFAAFAQIQKAGHHLRTSSYYIDLPIFLAIRDKENHLFDNRISELFCRGLGHGTLFKYNDFPCQQSSEVNSMTEPMIEDILSWYQTSNLGRPHE